MNAWHGQSLERWLSELISTSSLVTFNARRSMAKHAIPFQMIAKTDMVVTNLCIRGKQPNCILAIIVFITVISCMVDLFLFVFLASTFLQYALNLLLGLDSYLHEPIVNMEINQLQL